MSKKIYAVKIGRSTGIYRSWAQCSQQVTGFPGAVFKGFDSENEASEFLGGAHSPAPHETLEEDRAAAYVDGSFSDSTNEFSYGVVLFYRNTELRLSEKFSDSGYSGMRNVAGEIKAAEKAMQYCLEKDIKYLDIYHDYEGVACWCTGEWKANKPGTIAYKAFYDSLGGRLRVTFYKVKGHSGNIYNDAADKLARTALGL